MKLTRIKAILNSRSTGLPILYNGVKTKLGLSFSDLQTWVYLQGVDADLGAVMEVNAKDGLVPTSIVESPGDYPHYKKNTTLGEKITSVVLTDTMKKAIEKSMVCIDEDSKVEVISCLHFTDEFIEGSDGCILYKEYHETKLDAKFDSLIPKKSAEFILNSTKMVIYQFGVVCAVDFEGYSGTVVIHCIDEVFPTTELFAPAAFDYQYGTMLGKADIRVMEQKAKSQDPKFSIVRIADKVHLDGPTPSEWGSMVTEEYNPGRVICLIMPSLLGNKSGTGFNASFLKKLTSKCSGAVLYLNTVDPLNRAIMVEQLPSGAYGKKTKVTHAELIEKALEESIVKRRDEEHKKELADERAELGFNFEDFLERVIKPGLERMSDSYEVPANLNELDVEDTIENLRYKWVYSVDIANITTHDFQMELMAYIKDHPILS